MKFEYAVQEAPRGLAEAFIMAKSLSDDSCASFWATMCFTGRGLRNAQSAVSRVESSGGATIFGYYVKDPVSYGSWIDENGKALSIEEKPAKPKSHYAVPGLYFYDNRVVAYAANTKPSARGEIEITTVNNTYLDAGNLSVEVLGRGLAWLDTGTYDNLLEASNYIATIQKRQGMYVSCIEEIAYRNGWIGKEELLKLGNGYKTEYGEYLNYIAENM